MSNKKKKEKKVIFFLSHLRPPSTPPNYKKGKVIKGLNCLLFEKLTKKNTK